MVRLNRIYTRTGDDGTTGLVDGSRIAKSDRLMAAIGDVDEANCAVGVAIEHVGEGADGRRAALLRIQNELFDLGADLATPLAGDEAAEAPGALRIVPAQVERIEGEIDAMNDTLAPLRSFVLPGGDPATAALHVARAVVRRAERSAVAAGVERALNPLALAYLNRLSDHLFVMARLVALDGDGERLWEPAATR